MTRRGENPCLICRELAAGPKGGVVCPECVRKVADYDAMRERAQQGQVSIRLPQYPYVPGRGDRNGVKCEQLDKLLCELRQALERPAARRGWHSWAAPGELAPAFDGEPRERYVIEARDFSPFNVDAALAQVLIDLEPMIQHAVNEAHANGKREGSNLLAQLAAGELTTSEFEKRAGIIR